MPARTCLFCRRARDKGLLVRFVLSKGVLRADLGGRLPGRGAYLCRARDCIEGAFMRKGAFARALRHPLTVLETDEVERLIKEIGA